MNGFPKITPVKLAYCKESKITSVVSTANLAAYFVPYKKIF